MRPLHPTVSATQNVAKSNTRKHSEVVKAMALCDCSELSCYPVLICDFSGYWQATKHEVATMVCRINGCNGIFSNFQYNVYSQGYPNFQQQQPYIEAHLQERNMPCKSSGICKGSSNIQDIGDDVFEHVKSISDNLT